MQYQLQQLNINIAETALRLNSIDKWKHCRTRGIYFIFIKCDFFTEPYIFRFHNKMLPRLRTCCLDVEIEIGR